MTAAPLRRALLWIIPPLLQLVLGLPLLDRVPRLYNDEAWEASLGRELAENGTLRHGIIHGWGGMHEHFVQNQVVMPFVLTPVFRLLGVGAWQARLASVLMSVVAVGCICGALRRLLSAPWALFATLLVVVHPWFFTIARCARPEIYYVAFGYAGLWALLAAIGFFGVAQPPSAVIRSAHNALQPPSAVNSTAFDALQPLPAVIPDAGRSAPKPASAAPRSPLPSPPWALAALFGLFAGLSTLTHPTGLVLVAAMFGGAMIGFGPRRVLRLAPAAALGFALTLLPYVIYAAWAVRDPAVSFFEQMTGHRQSPLDLAHPMRLLWDERSRWMHFFQWPRGAPWMVVLSAAWMAAWVRRRAAANPAQAAADRAAATAILLFALAMPFTTVNTTSRYLIALVPLFAYLLVRMLHRVGRFEADEAGALTSHARDDSAGRGQTGTAFAQPGRDRVVSESPSPLPSPFKGEGAGDADARNAPGGGRYRLDLPASAPPSQLRIAQTRSFGRLAIAGILLAAYALPCLAAVGLMLVRLRDADLNRVIERVAAVTGPDARVFGRMLLWFGEPRYQYGPFPIDHRWRIDEAAVRAAGFDFAVRSAWDFGSSAGVSAPPAEMPPFRATDDIDPICERYGTLVAAFRDPAFGPFEVYRLEFNARP